MNKQQNVRVWLKYKQNKAAGTLGCRYGAPKQEDVAKTKIAPCFPGLPIENYKWISQLSEEREKQLFEQFEEESDLDFDDTDDESNTSEDDSSCIAFEHATFEDSDTDENWEP